jgi:hypothetical protein
LTTNIEPTTIKDDGKRVERVVRPGVSDTVFWSKEFGVRVGVIGRMGRPSVEPLVTQGVIL